MVGRYLHEAQSVYVKTRARSLAMPRPSVLRFNSISWAIAWRDLRP